MSGTSNQADKNKQETDGVITLVKNVKMTRGWCPSDKEVAAARAEMEARIQSTDSIVSNRAAERKKFLLARETARICRDPRDGQLKAVIDWRGWLVPLRRVTHLNWKRMTKYRATVLNTFKHRESYREIFGKQLDMLLLARQTAMICRDPHDGQFKAIIDWRGWLVPLESVMYLKWTRMRPQYLTTVVELETRSDIGLEYFGIQKEISSPYSGLFECAYCDHKCAPNRSLIIRHLSTCKKKTGEGLDEGLEPIQVPSDQSQNVPVHRPKPTLVERQEAKRASNKALSARRKQEQTLRKAAVQNQN